MKLHDEHKEVNQVACTVKSKKKCSARKFKQNHIKL